jgi:hypothetical protein
MLAIARKHNASHIKIGDIEVVFGLPNDVSKYDRVQTLEDEVMAPKDLAAEEYFNLQNL